MRLPLLLPVTFTWLQGHCAALLCQKAASRNKSSAKHGCSWPLARPPEDRETVGSMTIHALSTKPAEALLLIPSNPCRYLLHYGCLQKRVSLLQALPPALPGKRSIVSSQTALQADRTQTVDLVQALLSCTALRSDSAHIEI